MNSESSNESLPMSRGVLSEPHQDRSETDLKVIENRLSTYTNWPIDFISPTQLAEAGFYYLDIADQVKCAFCGGIIGHWEVNDQPLQEHRKFFPDCVIVRLEDQRNEEIGIQAVRTPNRPEYSTLDTRIRSFIQWDATIQDPTILAQAGFFYLGTGDEVRTQVHVERVDALNAHLILGPLFLL